jgi:hypothetical protein
VLGFLVLCVFVRIIQKQAAVTDEVWEQVERLAEEFGLGPRQLAGGAIAWAVALGGTGAARAYASQLEQVRRERYRRREALRWEKLARSTNSLADRRRDDRGRLLPKESLGESQGEVESGVEFGVESRSRYAD